MKSRIIAAAAFLLISSTAWSQEFKSLGSFNNVRSSDGGEHCRGYSLALWQSGPRLLGLLDVHQGLCGDPPCGVLRDASLDPKTGRLRFWSPTDTRLEFAGRLSGDVVSGTLNGEPVRLTRDRNGPDSTFKANQSLANWCGFWSGVGRCRGVRELCASLRFTGGSEMRPGTGESR